MPDREISEFQKGIFESLSGPCQLCGAHVTWGVDHRLILDTRDNLLRVCRDQDACALRRAVRSAPP